MFRKPFSLGIFFRYSSQSEPVVVATSSLDIAILEAPALYIPTLTAPALHNAILEAPTQDIHILTFPAKQMPAPSSSWRLWFYF